MKIFIVRFFISFFLLVVSSFLNSYLFSNWFRWPLWYFLYLCMMILTIWFPFAPVLSFPFHHHKFYWYWWLQLFIINIFCGFLLLYTAEQNLKGSGNEQNISFYFVRLNQFFCVEPQRIKIKNKQIKKKTLKIWVFNGFYRHLYRLCLGHPGVV